MSESKTGTPTVLPRPDFHFTGQVGRTYLESDPAQFPQPVAAPKGAPKFLLILVDDCGFAEDLRYNRGRVPKRTSSKVPVKPGF